MDIKKKYKFAIQREKIKERYMFVLEDMINEERGKTYSNSSKTIFLSRLKNLLVGRGYNDISYRVAPLVYKCHARMKEYDVTPTKPVYKARHEMFDEMRKLLALFARIKNEY